MMPGTQKAARSPGSPPPNSAMTSSIIGTATSGPTPCADWSSPIPVPRCRLNHMVTDAVNGTWKIPMEALRMIPKNR